MIGGVTGEALHGTGGGVGEAVTHGKGDDGVAAAVDDEDGEGDGFEFGFGFKAVGEEEGDGEDGVVILADVGHAGEGGEGDEAGDVMVGGVAVGEVDGDGCSEGPTGGDEFGVVEVGAGEEVVVGGVGGVVAALFGGFSAGHAVTGVVRADDVGAEAAELADFLEGVVEAHGVAVEIEEGGLGGVVGVDGVIRGEGFSEEGGDEGFGFIGGMEVEEFGERRGGDDAVGGALGGGSGENEMRLEECEHEACDQIDKGDGAEETEEDAGEAFAWGYCNGWGGGHGGSSVGDSTLLRKDGAGKSCWAIGGLSILFQNVGWGAGQLEKYFR